jgi:upstream activation factor subunit UAF30
MVSDAEIVRHLTAVLKNADLNTTTTTAIRLQLQSDLGVDLSEKKAFIREQVDLYLQKQSQEQPEGEAGGGDEGGEEGGERGEGEEDEDGDGEEGEEDESDSKRTSRSSKTRGEPDSKRMQAKIDRAIKARYKGQSISGLFGLRGETLIEVIGCF